MWIWFDVFSAGIELGTCGKLDFLSAALFTTPSGPSFFFSLSLSFLSTRTRVLSLPLSHSLHTFLSHARLLAGLLQSHAPAPLSDFLSINVSFFLPSLSQALFFVFRVSVFLSFALSFAVSLPVANTRSRLGHWNCFVQNCLSRNTKHPERKANTCQSQKKRTW